MIEEKLSRKDWKITKKSVRDTAWCTMIFETKIDVKIILVIIIINSHCIA